MSNNIKSVRMEKHVTQRELAQKLGVDAAIMCRWESGKTMPRVQVLLKIAAALECSVEDLVSIKNEGIDENANVCRNANKLTETSTIDESAKSDEGAKVCRSANPRRRAKQDAALADEWED